ncbi:hypothetical protein ACN9MZ_26125 [Pseudoduganella sp. S-14]|uniref:hypothetical protein n=1 Tax=Pseudoduganella sp. S-14 TaxID=3404065 RepID=UPI003CEA2AA6
MGYKHSIDPYVVMLKQSERKAIGYGLLALLILVIAIFVTSMDSERAGQLAPAVDRIRYTIALGLVCGCGLFALLSLWYIGKYAYFFKWPERFD